MAEEVELGEFFSNEPDTEKAQEHLKRSVASICRADRGVEVYYVGKASGEEATPAIWRRYDAKKEKWKLNEVWALYQSADAAQIDVLETALNSHFKKSDPDRFLGERDSGGRPSEQPKHFIYVALRRKK